jgi:mRNA-degrading endonuclease RelE of RelBE toxin-antitoxin system
VSVTEIIQELPKLSAEERAAVEAKLRELEEQECIRVSDATAAEGARLLDAMEQQDAESSAR